MINLTRQERLILIFFVFAVLSGIVLNICFKKIPYLNSFFYSEIFKKNNSASKLNINLADKEDLVEIKGIGPILAQRIIDYRALHGPFLNIEEIIYVKGIGRKKLQQIKDVVKID